MDSITIKQAFVTDTASVVLLYEEAGWWDSSWDSRCIRDIITSSYLFLVVKREGELIGMGRLISDGVSDAYLQDIYVTSTARGLGIGTAIIEKLLNSCHEAGIEWIGLIAAPETEFFYRKFGFARMGGYTPMRYEGRLPQSGIQDSHADKTV
ncbi:MAG: GNAT family N-acetyltransferase [Methanospirillaceae archaeon]|nr:GNAT family N-acetyltransferase [Methanospirillaceae archaeon]